MQECSGMGVAGDVCVLRRSKAKEGTGVRSWNKKEKGRHRRRRRVQTALPGVHRERCVGVYGGAVSVVADCPRLTLAPSLLLLLPLLLYSATTTISATTIARSLTSSRPP